MLLDTRHHPAMLQIATPSTPGGGIYIHNSSATELRQTNPDTVRSVTQEGPTARADCDAIGVLTCFRSISWRRVSFKEGLQDHFVETHKL
jgi:hypothetical protein